MGKMIAYNCCACISKSLQSSIFQTVAVLFKLFYSKLGSCIYSSVDFDLNRKLSGDENQPKQSKFNISDSTHR